MWNLKKSTITFTCHPHFRSMFQAAFCHYGSKPWMKKGIRKWKLHRTVWYESISGLLCEFHRWWYYGSNMPKGKAPEMRPRVSKKNVCFAICFLQLFAFRPVNTAEQRCAFLFVCLFVCSFIRSFVHSFIRSFVRSFVCLFVFISHFALFCALALGYFIATLFSAGFLVRSSIGKYFVQALQHEVVLGSALCKLCSTK